ncbi:hypothetical protein PUNSTDRAFT_132400 [Punctularia strigosozonata HHB-11173 SS5]|uniref:uncharacterized protein n=1 Tax=Punctularia strigosozonata (strain HHB-11173) TaxID=741275 RepID=UPI00044164B8|nr:uncharacterized protein PUNSTDRAFT_132400 [Punctularia strigosozonata HHB-11173 SS5]EIN10307.1 hypothetical protein PUNSTDRAFT_132400 [Punctularia strigosozonata HHB-11173 SS5]
MGCSLSLVSKPIRTASDRYRYQTVVLRNQRQIKSFLVVLKFQRPKSKPPPSVTHLCAFYGEAPFVSPATYIEQARRQYAETSRALDELLTLVGPTLVSCALIGEACWYVSGHPHRFKTPLPALRALWTPDVTRWDTDRPRLLPALESLHITNTQYTLDVLSADVDARLSRLCGASPIRRVGFTCCCENVYVELCYQTSANPVARAEAAPPFSFTSLSHAECLERGHRSGQATHNGRPCELRAAACPPGNVGKQIEGAWRKYIGWDPSSWPGGVKGTTAEERLPLRPISNRA